MTLTPVRKTVELLEWSEATPEYHPLLRGTTFREDRRARALLQELNGRVEVREGYDGIEIRSNSFVGQIDIGDLRIAIRPKLPGLPLSILLAYAYGLRDLSYWGSADSPLERWGMQDILLELLSIELQELVYSGLVRQYVRRNDHLATPRGRIRVNEIIRRGGIVDASLPCDFFSRSSDWHLNQVLRTGAMLGARLTEHGALRQRLLRTAAMFGEVIVLPNLHREDLDRADRELTRITECGRAALQLIRLLLDGMGISSGEHAGTSHIPGFLFDMNRFFQRLLSRFLHENLPAGSMADERSIRNVFEYEKGSNIAGRGAPNPRPDYAVYGCKTLLGFMDAKYRDIWGRGLPASWLYQLSIYALASPSQVAILLYASTSDESVSEGVSLRRPSESGSQGLASILMRPVHLTRMADLVHPNNRAMNRNARRRFAEALIAPLRTK